MKKTILANTYVILELTIVKLLAFISLDKDNGSIFSSQFILSIYLTMSCNKTAKTNTMPRLPQRNRAVHFVLSLFRPFSWSFAHVALFESVFSSIN